MARKLQQITREAFLKLAKFRYPTHQISFCTNRALTRIKNGSYDTILNCKYSVLTYWDIGKVYKRLIIMVNYNEAKFYK